MADTDQKGDGTGDAAAVKVLSLSQVLLAPLDAIFKAQIHAARSFLNFVLQLSYPDVKSSQHSDGTLTDKSVDKLYQQQFVFRSEIDGRQVNHTVTIPVLALVPINPLAVQEATFQMQMTISSIAPHSQMRASERGKENGDSKRPWFLVENPVSLRGTLAPPGAAGGGDPSNAGSTIDIKVRVAPVPIPSGLDKLLTTMSQRGVVTRDEGPTPDGKPAPDASIAATDPKTNG